MSYILSLINGCAHQLKIAREIQECQHQLPSISLFHLRNAREIGIKPREITILRNPWLRFCQYWEG